MKIAIRLSHQLFADMTKDLARSHEHAGERVSFLFARLSKSRAEQFLFEPTEYVPVEDERYLHDEWVGASIDAQAIRSAMQRALQTGECVLHVHSHGGWGLPGFSSIDLKTLDRLVPSFRAVARDAVHGGLVLSRNCAHALLWLPGSTEPTPLDIKLARRWTAPWRRHDRF